MKSCVGEQVKSNNLDLLHSNRNIFVLSNRIHASTHRKTPVQHVGTDLNLRKTRDSGVRPQMLGESKGKISHDLRNEGVLSIMRDRVDTGSRASV
jgi:hypothetical protein